MGDHTGGVGRKGRTQRQYQKFTNDDEVFAFMKSEYDSQTFALDNFQQEAITEYTGSAYDRINSYLRGEEPSALFFPEKIYDLDQAFAKQTAVLRHDLVLQRSYSDYSSNLYGLKIGDVFTDYGFTSTSILPDGLEWGVGHINIEIRAPRGTRALWVAPLAKYSNEGEVLLARGTSFRVVGTNENKPILEVIGQVAHG